MNVATSSWLPVASLNQLLDWKAKVDSTRWLNVHHLLQNNQNLLVVSVEGERNVLFTAAASYDATGCSF